MSSLNQSLFERLSTLLDPLDPAELHGLLCGLLCADRTLTVDGWLARAAELLDDPDLAESARDVLSKFFEYGKTQLDDPDCAVTPLLPDDDTPLDQRTEALGRWSQGLLYGLGVSGIAQRTELSAESQEFLRDAADIAQADFDRVEATEADETAYVELVESLRVGLLLLQHDLDRPSARINPDPEG